MRTLSTNFHQNSNTTSTRVAYLELLHVTIFENNGTETVWRFVNNKEDIVSNGDIYDAASFTIRMGADRSDSNANATLDFDSGDRNIIRKLREVNKRPVVKLSLILSNQPDVVEIGPIAYEVESADINQSVVSIGLTVEPLLEEPIPADRYTPRLFSGLWGNISFSDIPPTVGEPPEPDQPPPSQDPDASEPPSTYYQVTGLIEPEIQQIKTIITLDDTWIFQTSYGSTTATMGGISPQTFEDNAVAMVRQRLVDGSPEFTLSLGGRHPRDSFGSVIGTAGNRVFTKDAILEDGGGIATRWIWKDAEVLSNFLTEPDQEIRIFANE